MKRIKRKKTDSVEEFGFARQTTVKAERIPEGHGDLADRAQSGIQDEMLDKLNQIHLEVKRVQKRYHFARTHNTG